MPKVGKEEFAYTQEGIAEAKAMSEETGTPVTNAPDRVKKYQLGGMTKPPTSPSITPTSSYKKGGIVKKAIGKIKDKRRIKELEKSLKGVGTPKSHQKAGRELAYLKQKGKEPTHKITGIAKPKKKGLKPAKVPSNPPLFKGDTVKEKFLKTSILYNMGQKAAKKVVSGKKRKKK
tara:strand:+ start:954 stop:1478 length:525 start_codon:yes stop_codon:yes gene_type:complete